MLPVSLRMLLDRGSRLPASLMVALLLGTTGCPGDDAPAMTTTGEDSTTGETTTTTTPVTVTATVTDTTTDTPDTDTVGLDSTTGPTCGDGVVEGDEQCDGTDLGGEDCVTQGFSSGRLACAADCTFDTAGCTSDAVCGDDMIDPNETCDGTNLGGEDCVSQGFDGGRLACAGDCSGYDTSMCTSAGCDDEDIGMMIGDAVSMGSTTMADDDFEPSCGGMSGNDHVVLFTAPADGGFIFDTIGSDYDTKLALFSDCDDATELACNDDTVGLLSEVQLDMTAGQAVYVVIDGFDGDVGNYVLNINPAPVCGDGVAAGSEVCDGDDAPAATCDDTGFGGAGPVACAADCTGLDASTCNPPTGYGNCGSFTPGTVCTAEEICANDGDVNAACLEADTCMSAADCGPAPATGTAPVTCADIIGDVGGDCYLSCELGETCPTGMICALDFICLWPPL